jgi:hypothetical protein
MRSQTGARILVSPYSDKPYGMVWAGFITKQIVKLAREMDEIFHAVM